MKLKMSEREEEFRNFSFARRAAVKAAVASFDFIWIRS